MSEQMAIIKDVGFGLRDMNFPMLWFTTYITEHEAALQCLSVDDAIELIKAYWLRDVHDLEGKACWVEVGSGLIKYVRPAKI